jgi:hypothetical protein
LSFLDLVNPDKFNTFSEQFPAALLTDLLQHYPNFDPLQLKNELVIMYEDPEIIGQCKTPADMLRYIDQMNLTDSLKNLYKLLLIIVTIPITSASVERSFSALERIKTYSRNSMGQDRLCDVSVISIERELVKFLSRSDDFYNNVIEFFAEQKNRRIPLKYKTT